MDYYSLKLKIQGINKSMPNIEYGGCGTFSYHLHKVAASGSRSNILSMYSSKW